MICWYNIGTEVGLAVQFQLYGYCEYQLATLRPQAVSNKKQISCHPVFKTLAIIKDTLPGPDPGFLVWKACLMEKWRYFLLILPKYKRRFLMKKGS